MNAKKLIYLIIELLFVAVIPAVLVFVNYTSWSNAGTGFKISLGGIILLLIVFYCFRKIWLNKYIDRLRDMTTMHLSDYKIETDPDRKAALKTEIQNERTIESILNIILPALLLVAFFVVCRILEQNITKLSGTIGLIGASELVGFLFSVVSARTI